LIYIFMLDPFSSSPFEVMEGPSRHKLTSS
jgi:hypothetical protein